MPNLAELTDQYPQQDNSLPVAQPYSGANLGPLQAPSNAAIGNTAAVVPSTDAIAQADPNSVGSSGSQIIDKLLGLGGQERYQLWPEKVVRDALAAPHDALAGTMPQYSVDPSTGDVHTSPQMIAGAQAVSALAGSGGLAGVGEDAGAALGAGPFLRPALKIGDKIYKAPIKDAENPLGFGAEHSDALPAHLADDFYKKAMSGDDINHYNFGFVNHKGQFLDREKALDYGIKEGLVDPSAGKYGVLTSTMLADSSKPGTAIEAMAKSEPFYSALEHNVNAISQPKMTGDQWLGTLANKPGVKPEELDWTGVKEFLQSKGKEPVTKAELQEHLQNNKVELKEVDKGTGELKAAAEALQKEAGSGAVINGHKLYPDEIEQGLWDGSLTPKDLPTNLQSHAEKLLSLRHQQESPTKYHSYQLPGGPLSRDTEILTNRGWKRIDAVEIGDVVMTRKDDAGILEWQPVEATPKVYAENLYHFYSQSIDMRVTENHQMIAKKRRRGHTGLVRITAKELWNAAEMLVPLTGVWEGKGDDKIFGFDANDLAELFGWYLAEGSYKRYKEGKNTIQLAQCKEYNPEKCARIEALLDRMGLSWRYYGDAYGIGIKNINTDLKELFHEQPTSEFKFVPYFFFQQSKSVIQSLLDGLILGDGCISIQDGRLDKTTFFTNSEQLAGDVQILILMTGKNANVRQRPSGLYCVGIKSKEWSSVDDAKFEIAPYNDFAFCVTVENHAIYVRRNGVAAFTGNSNYREKLLTLPESSPVIKEMQANQKRIGELNANKGMLKPEQQDELVSLIDKQKELKSQIPNTYKSSHWDEPNILAHVRMNDRIIDGKKSLHLEEIQSDWHQQGRDKGYQNDPEAKELTAKGIKTGVPNAPFKKSWHELALKRMIREAAEKGYDRLSWTPGEAQAARYDLSKQVEGIQATKLPDGTYNVMARPKGDAGYNSIGSRVPEKELANIVGKELAEKIAKQDVDKSASYKGLDLKIGGEGMKGFYDQIIPKALEKISGEKVKTAKLKPNSQDTEFAVLDGNGRELQRFSNEREADQFVSEAPRTREVKEVTKRGSDVHYIDINPALRDKALGKGFPLFSSTHMFTPVAGNPFEKKEKK